MCSSNMYIVVVTVILIHGYSTWVLYNIMLDSREFQLFYCINCFQMCLMNV